MSADGKTVSVVGYASLLSPASVKETTPTMTNFRYGIVKDHCRIFRLASIINIRRGLARGQHLATAVARPRIGVDLLVCLFDVPVVEVPGLLEREHRLRPQCVDYEASDRPLHDDAAGTSATSQKALMFGEYSDEEYWAERCGSSADVYHEQVGQFYSAGKLYRDDMYPVPEYVLRCCRACLSAAHPAAFLGNLLDASFLGDGKTSLRQHLEQVLLGGKHADEDDAVSSGWTAEELQALEAVIASAPTAPD